MATAWLNNCCQLIASCIYSWSIPAEIVAVVGLRTILHFSPQPQSAK